jgi:anti-sigma28 factor (negative regulator of flagellin synthesis)
LYGLPLCGKMEVYMKIDNFGGISNYNNISSDRAVKKPAKEETALSQKNTTDRVEIGVRTSTEDARTQIKENIIRSEKQKISSERLEAIRNKIRQNEYRVDTDEIVKSIIDR